MTPHQANVDEFMRLAGQDRPSVPTPPDEAVRILRARLILEEAFELIEKGLGINIMVPPQHLPPPTSPIVVRAREITFKIREPVNMVELADGVADLSVVNNGTASAAGIDAEPIIAAVDQANLRKFGPGGYRRDDGKWMKGPDWQPPDILGLLVSQGFRPENDSTNEAIQESLPCQPAAESEPTLRATSL